MLTRDNTLKNDQVTVREIIVAHVGNGQEDTYGEFAGLDFKSDDEKQQAARESSELLISRMAAHVEEVADEAIKIHLQQNFTLPDDPSEGDKPRLSEGNANCITRLSFQEFHFYPYEHRGPLSMNEFNKFIELIDDYVSTLPENFHMLIATLPVVDQHKRVYNMCMYVQSGTPPKIHTFAKNIPSSVDLEYVDTMTPLLTGGSQEISLINRIKKVKKAIKSEMKESNTIKPDAIDNLIKICSSNKEFTHEHQNNEPALAYQELLNACQVLKQKAASNQPLAPDDMRDLVESFNNAVNHYVRYIETTSKRHARLAVEKLSTDQLTNIALTDTTHSDLAINYDGTIHCSTAGGEHFTTIVDICLDHAYGVGYSRYNANLKRISTDKSLPIPTLMSHMVTSNTVGLSKKYILARYTAHADAQKPSVNDAFSFMGEEPDVIHLNNTSFGGEIDLCFFAPHPVESLRGHHQIKVDLHNLRVELSKLESAKSHYKTFNSSVEKRVAILTEKIGLLSQKDALLQRLDDIAKSLTHFDLEHLSSRTWVNGYFNLLANNMSLLVNGDDSDHVKSNMADYITAIRDEWANDNYSKHDKLANLLDEIETLISELDKKQVSASLNQPPLS